MPTLTTMRKAAMIYNPVSGRKRHRRKEDVEIAAQILRSAGVQVTMSPTRAAGSAGAQAREAIENGHDTIIACGGDGTFHDVLQGVLPYGEKVTMGCMPLGTGNVMGNDLALPRKPGAAARTLLTFVPRTVAAGKVEYQSVTTREAEVRYFAVMCGVGVDAQLPYLLTQPLKQRFGMLGYIVQGLRIYLAHDFPLFEVQFVDAHTGNTRTESASLALGVRVRDFGGFMRHFAPGASMESDHMQVVLAKTRNGHRLLQYMMLAAMGTHWKLRGIENVRASEIICRALPAVDDKRPSGRPGRIYSQADGELLGVLPVKMSVVPNAFRLLMPPLRAASSNIP